MKNVWRKFSHSLLNDRVERPSVNVCSSPLSIVRTDKLSIDSSVPALSVSTVPFVRRVHRHPLSSSASDMFRVDRLDHRNCVTLIDLIGSVSIISKENIGYFIGDDENSSVPYECVVDARSQLRSTSIASGEEKEERTDDRRHRFALFSITLLRRGRKTDVFRLIDQEDVRETFVGVARRRRMRVGSARR